MPMLAAWLAVWLIRSLHTVSLTNWVHFYFWIFKIIRHRVQTAFGGLNVWRRGQFTTRKPSHHGSIWPESINSKIVDSCSAFGVLFRDMFMIRRTSIHVSDESSIGLVFVFPEWASLRSPTVCPLLIALAQQPPSSCTLTLCVGKRLSGERKRECFINILFWKYVFILAPPHTECPAVILNNPFYYFCWFSNISETESSTLSIRR